MNSTLEITDNEFLIKLDRKKFNVSFVRNLLKMVEFTSPSEESFVIADRYYTSNGYSTSSEPDYFSNLDEK